MNEIAQFSPVLYENKQDEQVSDSCFPSPFVFYVFKWKSCATWVFWIINNKSSKNYRIFHILECGGRGNFGNLVLLANGSLYDSTSNTIINGVLATNGNNVDVNPGIDARVGWFRVIEKSFPSFFEEKLKSVKRSK